MMMTRDTGSTQRIASGSESVGIITYLMKTPIANPTTITSHMEKASAFSLKCLSWFERLYFSTLGIFFFRFVALRAFLARICACTQGGIDVDHECRKPRYSSRVWAAPVDSENSKKAITICKASHDAAWKTGRGWLHQYWLSAVSSCLSSLQFVLPSEFSKSQFKRNLTGLSRV